MEEERDIVVFSDDDGNEFELEVVDYFDHEEQEYAILIDPSTPEDEDAETEVYIMKVVVNGDYEEFLAADEDKMDALSAIVEKMFETWEAEDGECECEGECDCGCEHEHTDEEHACDCGCGCEK